MEYFPYAKELKTADYEKSKEILSRILSDIFLYKSKRKPQEMEAIYDSLTKLTLDLLSSEEFAGNIKSVLPGIMLVDTIYPFLDKTRNRKQANYLLNLVLFGERNHAKNVINLAMEVE